jgi:hypothetical protein
VAVDTRGVDEALEVQLTPLLIEQPWASLKALLTTGWSKVYDGYISTGESPPNRVTDKDVNVINRSMGTRSKRSRWEPIINRSELPELIDLDPAWDLILMSEHDWEIHKVPKRIETAVDALVRPYIQIAAATKVLHIKRPALVPVCDADVLGRLGVTESEASRATVAVCVDLRREGRRLLKHLTALQVRVGEELHQQISLVRILEVLIWKSHPNRGGAAQGIRTARHATWLNGAQPTSLRLARAISKPPI